jgi:hypothetical protein
MLPFTLKAFIGIIDSIKNESVKDLIYLIPVSVSFCLMALFIESKLMVFTIDFKNKLEIIEAKKNGKSEVELDIITIPSNRYSFIHNIRKNKNYIANQHMATYYDVKSVRAKGDFLQINFDRIVLGNFCLSAKFHSGFQYINCQQAFNKFDGKSIYFDLPDSTTFNQNFEIEVKTNNDEEFKITSIQVCRGNRLQNLMNNYTIEIIKKGAKSKTFQYNYDFIQPKKFNKCFILQLNAF